MGWIVHNLKIEDIKDMEPRIAQFLKHCMEHWFSSSTDMDMLRFLAETGQIFPLPSDYWGWVDSNIPKFDYFQDNARTFAFAFEDKDEQDIQAICYGIYDLEGVVEILPDSINPSKIHKSVNDKEDVSQIWVPRAIVHELTNIIPRDEFNEFYTLLSTKIKEEWQRIYRNIHNSVDNKQSEIWNKYFHDQLISIHFLINSVNHQHISVLRELGSEITGNMTHFTHSFDTFLPDSPIRDHDWNIIDLKSDKTTELRDKLVYFYNKIITNWYGKENVDLSKFYSESGQIFPLPIDYWGNSTGILNQLTFFKDTARTFAYAFLDDKEEIKGVFFGVYDLQVLSRTVGEDTSIHPNNLMLDSSTTRVARILFFDVSNLLDQDELEEVLTILIPKLGKDWSNYLDELIKNSSVEETRHIENHLRRGIQSVHFTISNGYKNFISTLWKFDPQHTSFLSYLELKTEEHEESHLLDHLFRVKNAIEDD